MFIGARRSFIRSSVKLPTMTFDCNMLASVAPFNALFSTTRAQTTADLATDLLPKDVSGQTINHFAANTPRFVQDKGIIAEATRTNRFLNSEAFVTQSPSANTVATWIVWMNGPGSITVAAGTAVGTGFGVATQGNPVIMAITTSGTIVCTASGTIYAANLESGSTPTSAIKTAGAILTRNIDVFTMLDPTLFNMPAGTAIFEWEDLVGNNASTANIFVATMSSGNTIVLQKASTGKINFVVTTGAASQCSLTSTNVVVKDTVYRAACTWDTNFFKLCCSVSLEPGILSDVVGTPPAGPAASVILASSGGAQSFNCRLRRFGVAPKAANVNALKKWAQAA